MITKQDVFDSLTKDLYATYPNIKVYNKRNLVVETLPCVWAKELDDPDTAITLNGVRGRISQFEIQVFSETNQELYRIVKTCKDTMHNMFYQCSMSQELDNRDDLKINRHYMRFNRIICDKDTLKGE